MADVKKWLNVGGIVIATALAGNATFWLVFMCVYDNGALKIMDKEEIWNAAKTMVFIPIRCICAFVFIISLIANLPGERK